MDIRIRAALYSIGFFVGIFVLASLLNAIAPYLEAWIWPVFWLVVLFVCVYHLILAKLKFEEKYPGKEF